MGVIWVKVEKSLFIITADCTAKLLLGHREFKYHFHFFWNISADLFLLKRMLRKVVSFMRMQPTVQINVVLCKEVPVYGAKYVSQALSWKSKE